MSGYFMLLSSRSTEAAECYPGLHVRTKQILRRCLQCGGISISTRSHARESNDLEVKWRLQRCLPFRCSLPGTLQGRPDIRATRSGARIANPPFQATTGPLAKWDRERNNCIGHNISDVAHLHAPVLGVASVALAVRKRRLEKNIETLL